MGTIEIYHGYTFSSHLLQKLYRERYLKLSQCDMSKLTGIRQPNLAAHESGRHLLDSVDAAFDSVGFNRWASSVATCAEEAEMIADLIDPTSREEYLTEQQLEQLGRAVSAA